MTRVSKYVVVQSVDDQVVVVDEARDGEVLVPAWAARAIRLSTLTQAAQDVVQAELVSTLDEQGAHPAGFWKARAVGIMASLYMLIEGQP